MRAFGARIYAVNTSGQTAEPVEFVGTLADLDKVLAVADVLVISMPLTRATRGIIGDRELARMKPSAILPNVLGSPHNSSIVAGSHTFAARHAAANVLRYLQSGSLAGTVRREDYLALRRQR
jgi:phosphoglycerate dehydrogenase-like enzyme